MLRVERTTKFKKDFRRVQKRRLDTRVFDVVVMQLAAEEPLSIRCHDHALTGSHADVFE